MQRIRKKRKVDVAKAEDLGFQYKSLIDATLYIRLLKVKTSRNNFAPITGDLKVVALSEQPQYLALWYVWGPEKPSVTIYLDGRPHNVRQSLYAFLWHHKVSGAQDLLWIDAICIDQANLVEKGLQVDMMGNIFRRGQKVIVWLGPAEKSLADALTCLQPPEQQPTDQISMREASQSSGRRNEKALAQLFENPYWSRLWVVQEFLLASRLSTQCGAYSSNWDVLLRARRSIMAGVSVTGYGSPTSEYELGPLGYQHPNSQASTI